MTPEHYLTVNELQTTLKVSRATVYRLMAKRLPFVTVGHHRRFLVRQVESWVRKDVLTPGDYRCLVCQWTGRVEQSRSHYSIHCPNCQTVAPAMVRIDRAEPLLKVLSRPSGQKDSSFVEEPRARLIRREAS